MFRHIRLFILRTLYKILVIKRYAVNKDKLWHYERLRTFCTIKLGSDKGDFQFIFKEDRRRAVREGKNSLFRLSSYFVELISPERFDNEKNPLYNKVIVVIKIHIFGVDYEALSNLLLDLYIDTFNPKE